MIETFELDLGRRRREYVFPFGVGEQLGGVTVHQPSVVRKYTIRLNQEAYRAERLGGTDTDASLFRWPDQGVGLDDLAEYLQMTLVANSDVGPHAHATSEIGSHWVNDPGKEQPGVGSTAHAGYTFGFGEQAGTQTRSGGHYPLGALESGPPGDGYAGATLEIWSLRDNSEDEVMSVVPPTTYAAGRATEFLAKTRTLLAPTLLPRATASEDGFGGVYIRWSGPRTELRLRVPKDPAREPSLYIRRGGRGRLKDKMTPADLAQYLTQLEQD